MRPVIFASIAQKDYEQWARYNTKIFAKINEFINDIDHHPFTGLGKPEPLKHELAGFWSRRISTKDRRFTKYLRIMKSLLSVVKGITVKR